MENFVKTSFELVNGNVVAGAKLMARSLVLVNENGVMYNITAKVRNTDKFSVIRALTKAVLVSMREATRLNSSEAAQTSKKRVSNKLIPALSCHVAMVTDKDGKIIPGSGLSVRDSEKDTKNLRKNGRMRAKCDKWLVHIPFLCYLTILLNLAEGAVYGGY